MKTPCHISAEEAARLVKTGDWVDYGVTIGQPDVFDAALAKRTAELSDVKIRSCITVRPRAVLETDPEGRHFHWFSWHFSGYDRKMSDQGIAHYMPINLGEIPDYYRRFIEPGDVAVIKVCPRDANGYYNFGGTNLWHGAILEAAKIVIVEVTEGLPFTHGMDCGIHESEVDFTIDGDKPAIELPDLPVTDVDRAVGKLVASEIEDGSCIQVGIGGMPNAVCSSLLDSDAKDLGIHSEMLTDSMVDLVRSGQATGARKTLNKGRHVYGFALGSRRLYDAIDGNPDFHCCPADYTNPPHIIMKNNRVVAINNTTQVDLTGQAASESDGFRHISGTGGQLQFVRGAYASKGGKSFICLSSVFEKGNVRKSRIVLGLTPGNTVTTTRMDQMYVVTEFGMVNLKGRSVVDRARGLISVAHPDFRDELERDARAHGLIPRTLFPVGRPL
ncbi:MAG: butyryl-CoA:acetate CoA-transferase [Roseovarius sp.]|nr:butyryl-CoA:acetate CoA-transferase [Roseovarius sp.]MCY4314616.1 butyryl-CoA:acetate CoA-transferase [Roseovarius sp.]